MGLADVVAEVVAIRAVNVVAGPDSGFPQPEVVIGADLNDGVAGRGRLSVEVRLGVSEQVDVKLLRGGDVFHDYGDFSKSQ